MVRQIKQPLVADWDSVEIFEREHNKYEIRKTEYIIKVALVAYQSNSDYYMEKINFKDIDGVQTVVGTSPIKLKDIINLKKIISSIDVGQEKHLRFEGIISNDIIWWNPAEPKKVIWIYDPKRVDITIGYNRTENTYNVPIGKMIFSTDGHTVKGLMFKNTLTKNGPLYSIPLPNFGGSTSMCNGSTHLSEYDTMEEYIQSWTNRIFLTKWSNENIGMGGIEGIKTLDKKKKLLKKHWIKCNTTVNDLIEWLS